MSQLDGKRKRLPREEPFFRIYKLLRSGICDLKVIFFCADRKWRLYATSLCRTPIFTYEGTLMSS